MAWRFNAPPGWPVPPDFVPPQGWVPDPAWPPAPAGWTYWVEAPVAGPAPWSDPYQAAAPGYGPPQPKRGLPGWAIGLIVAAVVFAVLSVLGVLVVGGLVVAALSNGGVRDVVASSAASDACDQASIALDATTASPDPASAGVQARRLSSALDSANAAAIFDDQYDRLRDDIAEARSSARRIATLPRDPSTWTTVQQQTATQEQAALEASGERISRTCSTIDAPFEDDFAGPTL